MPAIGNPGIDPVKKTTKRPVNKTHSKTGVTNRLRPPAESTFVTLILKDWPTPNRPYFSVLVGDGAGWVPTAGYAKWNVVDRPQRVGLTVFAGYDPVSATLDVQFEGFGSGGAIVEANVSGNPNVEAACQLLEYMAGRGQPLLGIPAAAAVGGPPPAIWIQTSDSHGAMTNLIPENYQNNAQGGPAPPEWLVSDISWDPNPLRDNSGMRLRQLATITFQEHVVDPLLGIYSATQSFKAQATSTAIIYSTAGANTLRKLALLLHGGVTLAQSMAALNNIRSIDKPNLKVGTAIIYPT